MKYNFKNVVAEYTGGGIYLFWGELSNGFYFLTDDYGTTLILNESPENMDESLFVEWQDAHTVEELTGRARATFCDNLKKALVKSNPDNMTDYEIERYFDAMRVNW